MSEKKKFLTVFGASGFIGKAVCRHFSEKEGFEVTAVERKSPSGFSGRTVFWDSPELDEVLSQTDVVVNFFGANIADKPWDEARKKELRDSRVEMTEKIKFKWIQALTQDRSGNRGKKSESKVKDIVLINASAIGYYSRDEKEEEHQALLEEDIKTEASEKGSGFLSDLTHAWEEAASFTADEKKVLTESEISFRSVTLRFGLVLGKGGGALPRILQATRWFLGAVVGSGKQWVSWIALPEVPNIIDFLLRQREITGPINVTAPQSLSFDRFAKNIGKHLGRPVWMRIPSKVFKKLMGERAGLLIHGDSVYPTKLLQAGYEFEYPNLPLALEALESESEQFE